MNKKEASAKQEKMVADYMGWQVVSGSGARPFRPGDVKNEHYLVECKTHVDLQDKVIFYRKHWEKICIESQSTNKYPALITDNGTQKSQDTWVMVPRRVIPESILFRIFGLVNTAKSHSTITFNPNIAKDLFRVSYKEDRINGFPEWCNNEQVVIMPLSEFKSFYEEQFER